MTDCERISDELLDDFLDGTLDTETRAIVESHLAACEGCRRELAAARALAAATAALPREVQPEHDLWPGIEARLGNGRILEGSFHAGPHRRGWLLAAAALFAAVILATVAERAWFAPGTGPATRGDGAVEAAYHGGDLQGALADYAAASASLKAALQTSGTSLSPETAGVVAENLRIIDGAIARVRAALATDPGNRDLTVLLVATYQKEIELLQRVTQLPARG